MEREIIKRGLNKKENNEWMFKGELEIPGITK